MLLISDLNSCPVQTFKLYRSKLKPAITSLWQKARQKVNYADPDWYEPRVVGRDQIEHFMKLNLSKHVRLDGDYTNHSIRSTVITTLDTAGYEARHIMAISSHKSEATIKEYSCKCLENKWKQMYDMLTTAMYPNKKSKPSATATHLEHTNDDETDHNINLQTLSFNQIDDFNTIDDDMLNDLLTDMPFDTENMDPNIQAVVIQNQPNAIPTTQMQTQSTVNNQINTVNNQHYPHIPQMVFNNSSVTINYNFGK